MAIRDTISSTVLSLPISNYPNGGRNPGPRKVRVRFKSIKEDAKPCFDPPRTYHQLIQEDREELETLFLKLDASISSVFVFSNRSEIQKIKREALALIKAIKENQAMIFNTRKSFALAGIKVDLNEADFFKEIKFSDLESPERTEELIERANLLKRKVFEKLRISFLKNNLDRLEKIFNESEDLRGSILDLIERLETDYYQSKNGSVSRVDAKTSILKEILKYHRTNNELKDLADYIGSVKRLNILERMEIYESLLTLKKSHPQLDKVKEKVPDYGIRLNKFLEDIKALSHIDGIAELVHQAAKNFYAKNDEGLSLPFVLGAFNEARLNATLQEKGYVLESIGAKYVENLPFIIDENGEDMLRHIDFNKPKKALKALQEKGLLSKKDGNPRMRKLLLDSVNHILYFDSETGKIFSHKKNRSQDDNRIFVRQANGAYALSEIDCICTDPSNSDVFYIEHKITPSSFLGKNLGKNRNLDDFERENPGVQTQLEKLMIIAQAHGTKPAIMIDLAKTKYIGIDRNSNMLAIKKFIKDVEAKRPDLPKVTIFDEQAQDITNRNSLAA